MVLCLMNLRKEYNYEKSNKFILLTTYHLTLQDKNGTPSRALQSFNIDLETFSFINGFRSLRTGQRSLVT